MAVNLSPIWGAGAQLFDNSGNVLSGGKIYTYSAGTTTPAVTYTDTTGNTAHSNPIILNSAGRVPYEIWLDDTTQYKFVLKDSNDTLIGTWDNIDGVNSNFVAYTGQSEYQTAVADQTVFTLTEIEYIPGANNLMVFVDGINQYGPNAQYAFVETDSTTVTFTQGLHEDAQVRFTTATVTSVFTYSVLSGPSNPTSGDGVNGDFYINTTTYYIFGPKTDSGWGTGTSLVGPQGDPGATGPAGPAGPAGDAATVTAGTTTTGAPGSSASVVNSGTSSAAVFDFTIPQGAKGDTGDTGATGATGPAGAAATIAAGTTTTGAPGSSASVVNSGTSSAAVFDFTIPQGATGAAGNGIVSVTLTSGTHAPGTLDTYTILFTDGSTTTFQVYNGANGTGSGTVTSVDVSGGTTGLTTSGGPITSFGTITLAGTLAVANGGTGQTSYTDGQLLIGNSTGNTLSKTTLTAGSGVSITNGPGSITIAATGGTGDVVGPASATDNAFARFDTTTGKLIQNGLVTADDAGNVANVNSVTFDTTPTTVPTTPGSLYWDSADGIQTLSLVMADGDAVQQIGEEQYYRIKASAPITNGQAVMFTGTVGASGGLTGAPATGLTASTASYVMGIATHDLATNDWGYVTSFGLVRGINTSAFTAGDILYLDPSVAGGLTTTIPSAPNPKVQVCAVVYSSSTEGSLFVRTTFGGTLGQYEGDVGITSPSDGQLLIRNQTAGKWVNAALTAGTGVSVTNGAGAITITNSAPDQTVSLTAGTGISVSGTYPSFTVTNTGLTAYPGSGIAVSTGSAWDTSKTAPTGDIVGTTDNQTLTTKTISGADNTIKQNESMTIAASDETTAITTGTAKVTFRAPYAMTLYQLPRASLTTASSSGNPAIDINVNGSSIFSTVLTIDATETTSTTAATPAVLSTTSIADDAQITIDVDTAGTGATGLKVTLYYRRT